MKIFLDQRSVKLEYYDAFIKNNPNHQFVFDVEDSYDAEVIISMGHLFDNQAFEQYHQLKYLALISAGYDTLDLEYLKKRKILVTNAKDVFSIQIAEDVIAKILYFNKNLKFHMEMQQVGEWKFKSQSHEIYGSTVGILGTGSIGQHVAERIKAFKTKVIGYKSVYDHIPHFDQIYTKQEGLYQLLKESDYVIVALPLNEQTKFLLDAKALAMMKPDALLINVARGEIIDQEALIKALISEQIRGAALDVTYPEPLPKDHILWTLERCFITPHNASASPMMHQRIAEEVIDTFSRYINHKTLDNKII